MSDSLQMRLRSSEGHALAERALAEIRRLGAWPTPLNFELWLQAAAEPHGPLSQEMARLVARGEPLTEAVSDALAERYLQRSRLEQEMREAGDTLDRQLRRVQHAVSSAQASTAAYGRTLHGASDDLARDGEAAAVRRRVTDLTAATVEAQRQNSALEARLTHAIGEVQRLRARLETAQLEAMTDALSNLPNRKAFDLALARILEETEAAGQPLCLAIIDIDRFKAFNDAWGHQTGDQVIRYVASVLARAAPPYFAARYGGEEFALILPAEAVGHAVEVVDAVRAAIHGRSLKRRATEEDLGAVAVSAGVAQRRRLETASGLIERADAALYAAKRAGRNRVASAETTAVEAA